MSTIPKAPCLSPLQQKQPDSAPDQADKELIKAQQLEYDRIYKETDELYHDFAKSCGLSDSAFWILYALQEAHRPYSQTDLYRLWFFSKQTVHSTLKQLQAWDLICLCPAPDNKKNKLVLLRPKGRALIQQTVLPLMEAERAAFARLSEEERQALLDLTRKHLFLLRKETEAFIKTKHLQKEGSPL